MAAHDSLTRGRALHRLLLTTQAVHLLRMDAAPATTLLSTLRGQRGMQADLFWPLDSETSHGTFKTLCAVLLCWRASPAAYQNPESRSAVRFSPEVY